MAKLGNIDYSNAEGVSLTRTAIAGFAYVRESKHMHNDIEVSRATIYRQANGCFHVELFYHMEEAISLYNLGEEEAVEEMHAWVDGHTK